MLKDKKTLETILSLGLENTLRIALGAIASILMGRFLGPESYGKFSYIISIVLIFSPIINFSMNEVLVKELVKNSDSQKTIFKSGLILRFILGGIGVLSCVCYAYLKMGLSEIFILICLYSAFFFLKSFDIIEYFFIAKERIKEISKHRSFLFAFTNLLKILFVFWQSDWQWFIYLSCIELLVVFFLYLFKAKGEAWLSFSEKLDLTLTQKLFKNSFPFFLINLMIILFSRVDQLMIWELLDQKNLGEYSVVVKWGELLNFIPLLLTSAFLPRIVAEHSSSKEGEESVALKSYFRLIFLASLVITTTFLLGGAPLIGALYGDKYILAPGLIRYYVVQIFFSFLFVAMVRYLLVVERMKSAIWLYSVALVLNLSMNAYFIPIYGLNGAVLSSVMAYLFSLLILLFDKTIRKGTFLYFRSLF